MPGSCALVFPPRPSIRFLTPSLRFNHHALISCLPAERSWSRVAEGGGPGRAARGIASFFHRPPYPVSTSLHIAAIRGVNGSIARCDDPPERYRAPVARRSCAGTGQDFPSFLRIHPPTKSALPPRDLPPPPGRSSPGFTLRNSHELRRRAAKLARPFRPHPQLDRRQSSSLGVGWSLM